MRYYMQILGCFFTHHPYKINKLTRIIVNFTSTLKSPGYYIV